MLASAPELPGVTYWHPTSVITDVGTSYGNVEKIVKLQKMERLSSEMLEQIEALNEVHIY